MALLEIFLVKKEDKGCLRSFNLSQNEGLQCHNSKRNRSDKLSDKIYGLSNPVRPSLLSSRIFFNAVLRDDQVCKMITACCW